MWWLCETLGPGSWQHSVNSGICEIQIFTGLVFFSHSSAVSLILNSYYYYFYSVACPIIFNHVPCCRKPLFPQSLLTGTIDFSFKIQFKDPILLESLLELLPSLHCRNNHFSKQWFSNVHLHKNHLSRLLKYVYYQVPSPDSNSKGLRWTQRICIFN